MKLTQAQIKKYVKYSIPQLRRKAKDKFNAYIRKRDNDQGCISCGSWSEIQAGHFYSGGNHPELEFNEDNVHSQCKRCNYFLSGNLINYRENLVNKIGEEKVSALEQTVAIYKKKRWKHDRLYLISIIETYKDKS